MKFSLATLFAVTTTIAWFLGMARFPAEDQRLYIGVSLIALSGLLFFIGLTIQRDVNGNPEFEKNLILSALEPTIKIAFVLIGISVFAFIALLFYVAWIIASA